MMNAVSVKGLEMRFEVVTIVVCCYVAIRMANRRKENGCTMKDSFHSFPSLTTDKKRAQEWIARIRRDPGPDFVINSNTKICSKHFIPVDFVCGGGDPLATRCVLKEIAIPSVFPWQTSKFQRTTTTSRLAAGEKQRGENYLQVADYDNDDMKFQTPTMMIALNMKFQTPANLVI